MDETSKLRQKLQTMTETNTNAYGPLVSIIIPAYNLEKYIVACVKSALGQTWENVEVIAVDDGSKDSTGTILDSLALEDSRLKVIHKQNAGVALARQTGIDASTGDYIGFLDADDIYYPEFVERAMSAMFPGDCDIVVEGLCRVHRNGTDSIIMNDKYGAVDGRSYMELYFSQSIFVGLCDKLYRRELFSGIESRPYRIGEDFYVGCQIAAKLPRVKFIDYVGYGYLQRPGSNVHNPFDLALCEEFCTGVEKALEDQSLLSDEERKGYANVLRLRWYVTFISKSRNPWVGDSEFASKIQNAVFGDAAADSLCKVSSDNDAADSLCKLASSNDNSSKSLYKVVSSSDSAADKGDLNEDIAGGELIRKCYPYSVVVMLRLDRRESLRPLVLAVAAWRRIGSSISRRFKKLNVTLRRPSPLLPQVWQQSQAV